MLAYVLQNEGRGSREGLQEAERKNINNKVGMGNIV
jgi:hypothetical protein